MTSRLKEYAVIAAIAVVAVAIVLRVPFLKALVVPSEPAK